MSLKLKIGDMLNTVKGGFGKVFTKKDNRTEVEKEIDSLALALHSIKLDDNQRAALVYQIQRLSEAQASMDEAKAKMNPKAARAKIDPNVIISSCCTALCVTAVICAENEHGFLGTKDALLNSKAMNFIKKH